MAVAEIYVLGVSTRKVTEVMKRLCGLEVSSTQVSPGSSMLNTGPGWRDLPAVKSLRRDSVSTLLD